MSTDQDYYEKRFYSLVSALRDWPRMPEPLVLRNIKGKFPEDWEVGKAIQRELGLEVVPPVTECEIGAGAWDMMTKGEWRQHRVDTAL